MSSKNDRPPKGERGFSLIEVLVVVAIMGMVAVILTVATSKALKRQRLETAAQEFRGFVDRAYILTTQQGRGVFAEIGAPAANGSRIVRLVEDTNENGVLGTSDQELERMTLTSDIVLANSTTASTAWPAGAGGTLVLLCDTLGRAVNPGSSQPRTATALVTLTHREMTGSGTLRPVLTFTVGVTPLWRPTVTKERG